MQNRTKSEEWNRQYKEHRDFLLHLELDLNDFQEQIKNEFGTIESKIISCKNNLEQLSKTLHAPHDASSRKAVENAFELNKELLPKQQESDAIALEKSKQKNKQLLLHAKETLSQKSERTIPALKAISASIAPVTPKPFSTNVYKEDTTPAKAVDSSLEIDGV